MSTLVEYETDGSTTDFAIPFTYQDEADVKVYRAGVLLVQGVGYTIVTGPEVRLTSATPSGDELLIKRETTLTRRVTFTRGAYANPETQLNKADVQTFNILEELRDAPDLTTDADGSIYFGDVTTDGTWRITRSGDDLVFQRLESSAWVTKVTVNA